MGIKTPDMKIIGSRTALAKVIASTSSLTISERNTPKLEKRKLESRTASTRTPGFMREALKKRTATGIIKQETKRPKITPPRTLPKATHHIVTGERMALSKEPIFLSNIIDAVDIEVVPKIRDIAIRPGQRRRERGFPGLPWEV